MEKLFAFRIYKSKNELQTVISTRLGLKYDENTGKIGNDLKPYTGMDYVLFDITNQKEVCHGVITENLVCKEEKKKVEVNPNEA